MKKAFYKTMAFLSMALITNAQASIPINTSDIPLSVCAGQWGFLDASGELDDFSWSKYAWGYNNSNPKIWSPNQAGVKINSNVSTGLREVVVRFQMSGSDISRFQSYMNFTNTSTRIPFALEIDIVDDDELLGNTGENDFSIVRNNLPNSAGLMEDVSASDSTNQLSALIVRPDNLQPKSENRLYFLTEPFYIREFMYLSWKTNPGKNCFVPIAGRR